MNTLSNQTNPHSVPVHIFIPEDIEKALVHQLLIGGCPGLVDIIEQYPGPDVINHMARVLKNCASDLMETRIELRVE